MVWLYAIIIFTNRPFVFVNFISHTRFIPIQIHLFTYIENVCLTNSRLICLHLLVLTIFELNR